MAVKLKKRTMVAVLLIITMLMTLFTNFALAEEEQTTADETQTLSLDYTFVAENDDYKLYVNEAYLAVKVEDKTSGAVMESTMTYDDGQNNAIWMGQMQSAIVLSMIKQNIDTVPADLVNDDTKINMHYTSNGFEAEVYWTEYQLGMTLKVSLEADGLVASIPDESIREDGEEYYIGTIMMYPYMGSSYLDSQAGYMFVPDGNGSLIYLDDKDGRFSSAYSNMIYGDDIGFQESDVEGLLWDQYRMINDPEEIIAPIYGMAHTDAGIAYLAVVEAGDMRAKIEALPNGVSIDYNRIFTRFIERKLYTQPTSNNSSSGSIKMVEEDRSHSDLQIRFMFLSDDKANYAGMANAYRNYLLDRDLLSPVNDTYKTRIDFLGTEREEWIIGTSAVVMTTVEDIQDIYADLKGQGVTDILSVYKGWQKGGLYDLPISTYKADRRIGGTNDLTDLIQEAEADGIQLYLYNDGLVINPDENNATFNVVKRVNKRKFEWHTHMDVYDTLLYLTPQRSEALMERFVTSYTKKEVDQLAIAGISSNLFSWSYSNDYYTRFECGDIYKNLIAQADESTQLILEEPRAYLWQYTDAFLDMPMSISDYIYQDEEIPFLSMVLKGVVPMYSDYVNFEANKEEYFLKLVETGIYPSFYITEESSAELIYTNSNDIYSSQYDVFRDIIVDYSDRLKSINGQIEGAVILNHEILGDDLRMVTYDNGVTIYVNYSEEEHVVDGVTIEAMDYKVVDK